MAAKVKTDVIFLVDLFLSDDPKLEDEEHPTPQGLVAYSMGRKEARDIRQNILAKNVGRKLKSMGDQMNEKYMAVTHKSLPDEVKAVFEEPKSKDEAEGRWVTFRDLLDKAESVIGQDENTSILAALLVSIRGLQYLGSGVRGCVLRYIREKTLDKDMKKFNKDLKFVDDLN